MTDKKKDTDLTVSRMKYLLIPALNNHFQTMQLLALAEKRGGIPFMLVIQTDEAADGAIRKLAKQQGVTLLAPGEAQEVQFDRVYAHAWTHDLEFLGSLRYNELFVYADGLSNRFRQDRLPSVAGYVFWGEELLGGCDWSVIGPGLIVELVSVDLIKSQWIALAEVMQISSQQLEEVVGKPDLLIAFRYWGSSIYSGLGLSEIKTYLSIAFGRARKIESVLLAPDFRWDLKISQLDLVKEIAPDSQVEELTFPLEIKKKLGHLCTLDLIAFNSKTFAYQVVAFDGSAALTYFLSSESTQVPIVIQPVFEGTLPADRLVSENIAAHLEIIEKGRLTTPTVMKLVTSETLSEAISFGAKVLTEDERNLLLARFVRDYRPPDTLATLSVWLRASSKKGPSLEKMKLRLRSGTLARRIFFWGFRSSFARRLIQVVKKLFL